MKSCKQFVVGECCGWKGSVYLIKVAFKHATLKIKACLDSVTCLPFVPYSEDRYFLLKSIAKF